MSRRMKSSLALLAIAATLLLVSTTACAQDQPAPKWEIFAGYSWADPNNREAEDPGSTACCQYQGLPDLR